MQFTTLTLVAAATLSSIVSAAGDISLDLFNDKVNSIKVYDIASKAQGHCNIFE
ncbi:hypothetical protein ANO14919_054440 [Xylariales sp. No.14919]|nr:hypothetical protein ANO14919_054440 [Xylariales sp. No.14919]